MSQIQAISDMTPVDRQTGHPEVLAMPHTISVVIPVFKGERTLKTLVAEILELNNK